MSNAAQSNRYPYRKARFHVGYVHFAPRAEWLMRRCRLELWFQHYLRRHASGDWGMKLSGLDLTARRNNVAVYEGGIITSRWYLWHREDGAKVCLTIQTKNRPDQAFLNTTVVYIDHVW